MAEEVGEVFGIDLDGLSRNGVLRLEERSRVGESLDEAGYRLLGAVKRSGVRRLFIDGLVSLIASPAYEERGAAFFAALFRELRQLEVTSLFSVRLRQPGNVPLSGRNLSPLADNSLRLNVAERSHKVVRSIAIAKVQASRHDLSIRELELTPTGMRVGAPLAAASERGEI